MYARIPRRWLQTERPESRAYLVCSQTSHVLKQKKILQAIDILFVSLLINLVNQEIDMGWRK